MDTAIYYASISALFGYGTRKTKIVFERYTQDRNLFTMTDAQLKEDNILRSLDIEQLRKFDRNAIVEYHTRMLNKGYKITTIDDDDYPEHLRYIYSPPLVLYSSGALEFLKERYIVSMVGTRRTNEYGQNAATLISSQLAKMGAVIVSGLAEGIDTVCHKGAIYGHSQTVAVLACGIDVNYPAKNTMLRDIIKDNGAFLTELLPGTGVVPQYFNVRNRIIAGLSMATVVVQAPIKSGALLTANHALKEGRHVFAVPGQITDPLMEGCNRLLFEGASPALSGVEILSELVANYALPLKTDGQQSTTDSPERLYTHSEPPKLSEAQRPPKQSNKKQKTPGTPKPQDTKSTTVESESAPSDKNHEFLSERQAKIYNEICSGEISVDELSSKLELPVSAVLPDLTAMEILGIIKQIGGRRFRATDSKKANQGK